MRDTKRHTMMTQLDETLDSSGSVIISEAIHREAYTKHYQFNGYTRAYTKRYVM
jgi:hypothetical protein